MTRPGGRPARHRGSRRLPRQRRTPQIPRVPPVAWVSWAREHMLLAALAPALVLAVAIGIVVTVSLGGKTASAGHPGAASAQSAVAVTKGDRWIAGRAGKLLAAVNADIGKLSTAQRAGKRDKAKAAGTRLAGDARAALSGPMPPVAAKVYRSALTDLEQAGTSAASGDFGQAGPLLNAGEAKITKVTAVVNRAAPVSEPGVVDPQE